LSQLFYLGFGNQRGLVVDAVYLKGIIVVADILPVFIAAAAFAIILFASGKANQHYKRQKYCKNRYPSFFHNSSNKKSSLFSIAKESISFSQWKAGGFLLKPYRIASMA
jgi:hypothetical protein